MKASKILWAMTCFALLMSSQFSYAGPGSLAPRSALCLNKAFGLQKLALRAFSSDVERLEREKVRIDTEIQRLTTISNYYNSVAMVSGPVFGWAAVNLAYSHPNSYAFACVASCYTIATSFAEMGACNKAIHLLIQQKKELLEEITKIEDGKVDEE